MLVPLPADDALWRGLFMQLLILGGKTFFFLHIPSFLPVI